MIGEAGGGGGGCGDFRVLQASSMTAMTMWRVVITWRCLSMYVGTDSSGVARNVEETDLFDRVSRQGYV